jgi:nucleotide-binding universal stress UspA family protein
VTEKVLRSTRVPVLIIPPPVHEPGSPVYKTILCPLDFSEASIRPLEYAMSLAKEANAAARLKRMIPSDADGGSLTEPRVTRGRAYREILKVVTDERVDLVVMGVQGKGVMDRLLLGSTTHRVIRDANCPVLTLHGGTANA